MNQKVILLFSLCWLTLLSQVSPQITSAKFSLIGCKAVSCDKLRLAFRLNKDLPYQRSIAYDLKNRITKFYIKNGYIYVRVFIVKDTPKKIIFYIDEGMFNRILFQNINTLDILKLRASFTLEPKVFHVTKVNKEVLRLKKKFNYKTIHYELRKAVNYSKVSLQLDKIIHGIFLSDEDLKSFDIPFPQYDLVITIQKKEKTRTQGFYMSARLKYRKGLIPYVDYVKQSLFSKDDKLLTEFAMGIVYALDLKFNFPPRSSLFKVLVDYHTTPLLYDRLNFKFTNQFMRVLETRRDIGLRTYYEIRILNQIQMGIRLFKNFFLDTGYGLETIFLTTPTYTEEGIFKNLPLNLFVGDDRKFLPDSKDFVQLLQLGFHTTSLDLENFKDGKLKFQYTFYFREKSFNRLHLSTSVNYHLEAYSFFSFAGEVYYIFVDISGTEEISSIPFYYDHRIAGKNFKGFLRQDIHIRKVFKQSNEYRISIYKDYIFSGLYFDLVIFDGIGYDLSGTYFGIAGGIIIQFLLLDQLNFNFYIGRDYLFRDNSSNFALYVKAFLQF